MLSKAAEQHSTPNIPPSGLAPPPCLPAHRASSPMLARAPHACKKNFKNYFGARTGAAPGGRGTFYRAPLWPIPNIVKTRTKTCGLPGGAGAEAQHITRHGTHGKKQQVKKV
tara:strand:- start:5492 stop:5827 length:336 start_codon:yes stop_codon:yes gene_type:complete